nr:spermatogenesis-associated protein 21-like [Globicephala melas]
MHNRNAQMYVEGRTKAPEAQPSPGLRTASNRAGVEPTISEVSQVVFTDAEGIDGGKQPSSEPGEPEDGPRHREASEEGYPELSTQEQMPPAGPSHIWPPQEGPGELQAGQNQATPGSELEVLPSRVPAAQERLQQQSSWKETKDQQRSQQNLGTVEGQFPESRQDPECQPFPGHLAANESDIVQPTEPCCSLDSCGQQLRDKPPKEVDTPPIRSQGALPEPGSGGHEDSPQEAMSLMPTATLEEKMAHSSPPSMPRPNTPKER